MLQNNLTELMTLGWWVALAIAVSIVGLLYKLLKTKKL